MTSSQTQIPLPLRDRVQLPDPHTQAALELAHDTLLVGLGRDDTPVLLPDDSVNVLVCASAGAGTTATLRALAAQAVRLGATVDVIDLYPGFGAHRWADRLEHVTTLHQVEDVHDRLLHHADSLTRRPSQPGWPDRTVVIVEDAAGVVHALRQYWHHTRPETQLAEAPAVTALLHLLTGGPARGVQVWAGNPSAELPGITTTVRRMFPARLLGHAGPALWQRAAPEVWAIPACTPAPGRMHLVADRAVTPVQALYLDHAQAHRLATTGGTR